MCTPVVTGVTPKRSPVDASLKRDDDLEFIHYQQWIILLENVLLVQSLCVVIHHTVVIAY